MPIVSPRRNARDYPSAALQSLCAQAAQAFVIYPVILAEMRLLQMRHRSVPVCARTPPWQTAAPQKLRGSVTPVVSSSVSGIMEPD